MREVCAQIDARGVLDQLKARQGIERECLSLMKIELLG